MELDLSKYREKHPNRMKRIVWAAVNAFVFPLLGNCARLRVLRWFGAIVDDSCLIYRSVKIFAPWNLSIGKFVCLSPHVELYNKDKVTIGDWVVISRDAFLCTASHDVSSCSMALVTKPIVIESQAWIAAKAIVLPGVTIGEGAVVGCAAVVAKDVPPWSVAVGNPARVVGKRELKSGV